MGATPSQLSMRWPLAFDFYGHVRQVLDYVRS